MCQVEFLQCILADGGVRNRMRWNEDSWRQCFSWVRLLEVSGVEETASESCVQVRGEARDSLKRVGKQGVLYSHRKAGFANILFCWKLENVLERTFSCALGLQHFRIPVGNFRWPSVHGRQPDSATFLFWLTLLTVVGITIRLPFSTRSLSVHKSFLIFQKGWMELFNWFWLRGKPVSIASTSAL